MNWYVVWLRDSHGLIESAKVVSAWDAREVVSKLKVRHSDVSCSFIDKEFAIEEAILMCRIFRINYMVEERLVAYS